MNVLYRKLRCLYFRSSLIVKIKCTGRSPSDMGSENSLPKHGGFDPSQNQLFYTMNSFRYWTIWVHHPTVMVPNHQWKWAV